MSNRYRGLPFSKEALTWYRRITGLQLTLGLIAFLFLMWNNNRDKGTYDIIDRLGYDSEIQIQALERSGAHELLVADERDAASGVGYLRDSSFDIKYSLQENESAGGLTWSPHGLWLLTRHNEKAYLLDADNFEELAEVSYEGEGWGLAYDSGREVIYMSNQTSNIQVRDPESFGLLDTFEVRTPSGLEISSISELEYDGDHLYASLYPSNRIIRIEVERFNKGRVTNEWDFEPFVSELKKEYPDVQNLNGIAHLHGNQFFITGQYFPYMYQVQLN